MVINPFTSGLCTQYEDSLVKVGGSIMPPMSFCCIVDSTTKMHYVHIWSYMICYCTPIFDSDFDCYKSSGYTSSPSPAANPWMNRHFSTQTAAAAKIWTGILGTPMQQQFGFPFMSWGPLTPTGGLSCVLFADFCFQTASAPGKCASFCGFDMLLMLKTTLLESLHAVCCFSFYSPNLRSVGATHRMGWGFGVTDTVTARAKHEKTERKQKTVGNMGNGAQPT